MKRYGKVLRVGIITWKEELYGFVQFQYYGYADGAKGLARKEVFQNEGMEIGDVLFEQVEALERAGWRLGSEMPLDAPDDVDIDSDTVFDKWQQMRT
jgi:hypothetical protein